MTGRRIAWCQDMDPLVEPGGAQMNDRAMIRYGLTAKGHDIQIVVPNINGNELGDNYDLVVISNAMTLREEAYVDLQRRKIPYVIFAHDYGPQLCKWRLYFPMEDRCQSLCYLRDRWRPHLLGAAGLVYLSPLHRLAWEFLLWGFLF